MAGLRIQIKTPVESPARPSVAEVTAAKKVLGRISLSRWHVRIIWAEQKPPVADDFCSLSPLGCVRFTLTRLWWKYAKKGLAERITGGSASFLFFETNDVRPPPEEPSAPLSDVAALLRSNLIFCCFFGRPTKGKEKAIFSLSLSFSCFGMPLSARC